MTRVRIREKKQDECNTAPTHNTIVESAIKIKVVKYYIKYKKIDFTFHNETIHKSLIYCFNPHW